MPPAGAQGAPRAPEPPQVLLTVHDGIATITFNRPERCNAWTQEMIGAMKDALDWCGSDPAVRAVVLTGAGKYYCSGVDFSSSMTPMRPSTLKSEAAQKNQALFDAYLDFPKPLVAAVNGPAIGASVTSAALCDAVIAAPGATFHTPFRPLGIVPEGCASINFPRTLGEEGARAMLEEARRVGAEEALAMGLAQEVVEPPQLLERAREIAAERAAQGRPRRFLELGGPEWHSALKEANRQESIALAESFLKLPFLQNQFRAAAAKGKTAPKLIFWTAMNLMKTPLARL